MASCRVALRSLSKSLLCTNSVSAATNGMSRYLVPKTANQMRLCTSIPKAKYQTVKVTFSLPEGEKQTIDAKVGDNLLDVIIENNVDIDGYGACEGTLACSTCHLIFKQEDFDKQDKPVDEELDMLDLAYGLSDTSRLGCQVIVTKDMDGMEVTVPGGVSDARSGGL